MAKAKSTSTIKYSDKSAGQPELVKVFESVKKHMTKYAKGNFVIKDDFPGNFSVYYGKPVELGTRKYPDMLFSSLLIQKGYVGFYFFPVYTDPSLKEKLPASLVKLLKGKSCFHLKKIDEAMLSAVDDALDAGLEVFKSKGWK